MNFRSYLACLTLLFIGMSAYSAQELPLNLMTATPIEITSFLESHQYINDLAEQCLNDGLANIPLANLEQLLAHEQLAAKILFSPDCANDITKENVHLFTKPVIDNLSSLHNTEVGDEIMTAVLEIYMESPDSEQILAQLAIDNFSSLIKTEVGGQLIIAMMSIYPGSEKLFVQLAIDNVSSLVNTESGCLILMILRSCPDSEKLFVQLAIDNFSSLMSTEFGCELISTIMEMYPNSAQLFIQAVLDNFSSLVSTEFGYELITEIVENYPDETEQPFFQAALRMLHSYLEA